MKTIMCVVVWLACASAAFASSNCDKPRDDFDGLYCLNKVYLQADKDLNDMYTKLVQKLDRDGKAILKQGQLAWIEARNHACSYRDQRGFFVNLSCATNTTIERAQFLNNRHRECISSGCLNSKLSQP